MNSCFALYSVYSRLILGYIASGTSALNKKFLLLSLDAISFKRTWVTWFWGNSVHFSKNIYTVWALFRNNKFILTFYPNHVWINKNCDPDQAGDIRENCGIVNKWNWFDYDRVMVRWRFLLHYRFSYIPVEDDDGGQYHGKILVDT